MTVDKDVSEMGMFELAHNSCYAKDGKARYRDYDLDIDARELTRKLLKDHADGDDSFTDDEDFDDWMMDYLQDGMDSIEGLIALFYRNLWAMADLRERLAEYEDLEEQGKLLKLPCAVRDRIYVIDTDERLSNKEIKIYDIDNIVITSDGTILLKYDAHDGVICESENIITDKPYLDFYRCFLTREEAEATLKELERGKGE